MSVFYIKIYHPLQIIVVGRFRISMDFANRGAEIRRLFQEYACKLFGYDRLLPSNTGFNKSKSKSKIKLKELTLWKFDLILMNSSSRTHVSQESRVERLPTSWPASGATSSRESPRTRPSRCSAATTSGAAPSPPSHPPTTPSPPRTMAHYSLGN